MKTNKGTNKRGRKPNPNLRKDRINEPEPRKPLPGEYPPSEDIMNPNAEMERVSIDPNNLSTSRKTTEDIAREQLEDSSSQPPAHEVTGSNLTKEDYEALGPRDLSLDDQDDEQLKHRAWPVDFAARDLDVPGSELDDRNESVGSEDEENNPYSLGGDSKENLEEDQTRTFG